MIRRRLAALSAVVVLGAPAHASAQSAPGLAPVGPFQEHFNVNVKVAGTTLVGLRRGSASGPLDVNALKVDLPANAKGMLCVDLSTRDGRYTASQDFRLMAPGAGPVALGLDSRMRRELRGYVNADLAVSAQLRDDCDAGGPGAFVASRWSIDPSDRAMIAFLNIKLARATAQMLDARGRPLLAQPVTCQSITAGSRTAFDHECDLPPAPAPVAELRIELFGTSGSHRTESYRIATGP